ncbi:hypothetical protein VR010_13835 [Actinomycetaceae bacterium L2_0104]
MDQLVQSGEYLSGRYQLTKPYNRQLPYEGTELWAATDKLLGTEVRILLLHNELPVKQAVLDAARRTALVDGARVIRVLSVSDSPSSVYVATEVPTGTNLSESVNGTPLRVEQVHAIVGSVAETLGAARQRGLRHLHITPDRLWITPDNQVYVDGIGIAAALSQTQAPDMTPADVDRLEVHRLLGFAASLLTGTPLSSTENIDSLIADALTRPDLSPELHQALSRELDGFGAPLAGDLARELSPVPALNPESFLDSQATRFFSTEEIAAVGDDDASHDSSGPAASVGSPEPTNVQVGPDSDPSVTARFPKITAPLGGAAAAAAAGSTGTAATSEADANDATQSGDAELQEPYTGNGGSTPSEKPAAPAQEVPSPDESSRPFDEVISTDSPASPAPGLGSQASIGFAAGLAEAAQNQANASVPSPSTGAASPSDAAEEPYVAPTERRSEEPDEEEWHPETSEASEDSASTEDAPDVDPELGIVPQPSPGLAPQWIKPDDFARDLEAQAGGGHDSAAQSSIAETSSPETATSATEEELFTEDAESTEAESASTEPFSADSEVDEQHELPSEDVEAIPEELETEVALTSAATPESGAQEDDRELDDDGQPPTGVLAPVEMWGVSESQTETPQSADEATVHPAEDSVDSEEGAAGSDRETVVIQAVADDDDEQVPAAGEAVSTPESATEAADAIGESEDDASGEDISRQEAPPIIYPATPLPSQPSVTPAHPQSGPSTQQLPAQAGAPAAARLYPASAVHEAPDSGRATASEPGNGAGFAAPNGGAGRPTNPHGPGGAGGSGGPGGHGPEGPAKKYNASKVITLGAVILVALALVWAMFTLLRPTRTPDIQRPTASAQATAPVEETPASSPTPTPEPTQELPPPSISNVTLLNPQGAQLDPSNVGEQDSPATVPNAWDGNPGTVWRSWWYSNPNFVGKEGIGLEIQLAEEAQVSEVVLNVDGQGGNVQWRNTPPDSPNGGDVVAEGPMGAETILQAAEPLTGSTVVLWFNQLPVDSEGNNRINISEIQVR